MSHIDPRELARWWQAMPTAERRRLSHLLECDSCRDAAARLGAPAEDHADGAADGAAPAPAPGPKILDYRPRRSDDAAPIPGASTPKLHLDLDLLARAETDRRRAGALFAELVAHPETRRRVLVANSPRFHSIALAARLLAAGREAGFSEPARGEHLARLAVAVLERCAPPTPRRLVDDLLARGWGLVGNALRQQERRDEAEEALRRAAGFATGSVDPLVEAEHCHLLSSLRTAQRRFAESESLLRRAAGLYREVGDDEKLARVLTSLGSQFLDRGCPEAALQPLREALADGEADPRTALFIHHNVTLALAETERYLEAQRMLRAGARFYEQFPDPLTQLRRRWLGGIVAGGLGDGARAEAELRPVLDAYADAGHHLHAASVGLDLAVVYARQGRQAELRELAAELAAVCLGGHLHREALAALSFFLQAVEGERATAALVRRVALFLKRAERDTGARFVPEATG